MPDTSPLAAAGPRRPEIFEPPPIPLARRVRAVARTAVVWGIAWTGVSAIVLGGLVAVGAAPASAGLLDVAALSVRFGIWGGICGAAFAAGVGLLLRGRDLARVNPLRATLVGAVGLALFVPLLMQGLNLLSGDGLVAWADVFDDSVWAFVLGGAATGGTLWLAKRGD